MSPLLLFLIFGGYAAAYWGFNLAQHTPKAGPVLYQAAKIGTATYAQLGHCG